MHTIEPYYAWRNHYVACDDLRSPFFERIYNEMSYHMKIYDHYIHPQWDNIGSTTLFIKILWVDYEEESAIIELFGEWNDCLHNDIMILKRDIIDCLQNKGICKFILIGENVLNFHYSDDSYYEEWFEEVTDRDGWIALLNFNKHVLDNMFNIDLDSYFVMGGELSEFSWRTYAPDQLVNKIRDSVENRLGLIG